MFEIFGYILIFISGTFIGSFLNVVSDRIQNAQSVIFGRSYCDNCKKALPARDMVPVLSLIVLKGKCSLCKKKISYFYPLSEILTGVLFVLVAYYINIFSGASVVLWITFAYFIVISSFYIIIFLSDLKYRMIPNKVVFPAIGFVLTFILANMAYVAYYSYNQLISDPFGKYLISVGYWRDQMLMYVKSFGFTFGSAVLIALFFLFLIFITKGRGMGGGDVKLGFLIGLVNAFPFNFVSIFIGFISGALVSIVLVVLKKRKLKDTIPFGPFLILGSITTFAFGQQIFNWYTNLLK